MKLLSILIPTLPERRGKFEDLCKNLKDQCIKSGVQDYVEILSDDAERGTVSIGEKRNRLKNKATGRYIVGIDDDDTPSMHYIHLIIDAIQEGKDIVTFSLDYYIDGKYNKTAVVNRFIGNNWSDPYWATNRNPSHRFTFNENYYHLCPVKKELVDQIDFIHENSMEDVEYSKALIPIIKTEKHIEHTLLSINFDSTK